jgi:NAD(P)-dependent dehydrogenase (short-subunit alcohol dehydrogenase family)
MPSYLVTGSSRGLGLGFVGELVSSSSQNFLGNETDSLLPPSAPKP